VEQSAWEAYSRLATEELSRHLLKWKFHYRTENSLRLLPILNQNKNPVRALQFCSIKIHFDNILPSSLGLQNGLSLLGFSDRKFVCISHFFHACYMLCPSYLPSCDHHNNMWWTVQLVIVKFSPTFYHYLPIRSINSPHQPVLRHPHFILFSQCERSSFTPIQWRGKIMGLRF
jgi:hypothetical protein